MLLQRGIFRKGLSTARLRTRKWFFTRMPSKMANQISRRREIFAAARLSTSVSLRPLLFLLLLAHTRVIHVITVFILVIRIFTIIIALAVLRLLFCHF
jgi:hypothetical protein